MTFEFEIFMPEKQGIAGELEVDQATVLHVAASVALNLHDTHHETSAAEFVVITVRRKPNALRQARAAQGVDDVTD